MGKSFFKSMVAGAMIFSFVIASAFAASPAEVVKKVRWYGQNSLRIELAGKIIWIDPVYGQFNEKADVILVTHSHNDHFAASKIKKLKGPNTEVWLGFNDFDYDRIEVGEVKQIGGLTIQAVPMYDLFDEPHHQKDIGFTGFVITGDGVTIYVVGDAGRMPEMKQIKADIIFTPLGKTYTMKSVEDAIGAVKDVGAKIAIPVHYGLYEGNDADADRFVAELTKAGITAMRLPKSE